MSELELIEVTLARTARRRRAQAAWRAFWWGFLGGAAVWLLLLGLYKVFPIPQQALLIGAGVWMGLSAGGLLWGLWHKPGLLGTARWVDDQQHYQERLSTALEVSKMETAGRWRDLVVTDAAAYAKRFDARAALPMRLPVLARWCVLILALSAGLGFVPEYRTQSHREQQKEAEMIRETGRQLTELVKRELASRPPVLEPTRQSLDDLQQLGQQLSKVKLNRTQALQELASMTDRIEQQLQELGKDPGLRKLEQRDRSAPSGEEMTPEGLQKKIDTMQEQLGKMSGDAKALDRMKQQLRNLQRAADALANADGAAADELKQEMSQAMAELSKQAEAMGMDLAGLDAAIQALAGGDIDQVLLDLDAAFLDLEQMSQMARAMEDLQQQFAELGRDLAEQLDKGQGLLAYATLKRMIKALEQADLTPEQLQEILAEAAKAVDPGLEYGQLGEFLRQATQEMQQGQKPAAAQSLAKAADELKRLMDQMSDCQGLLAALECLKAGQMCVGNNMSWGLCQGGLCRPAFKPGGRPGKGVGTWADEGLWMDPENSGLWDNSGIERPDIDPRGFTDRGEGQLNNALTPTKVRGQISPGGAMPSITLKGVNIRGQSRVDYEEVVTAAQSEAQSALSQDQVPRAYRGAVRDYFDDLK